MKPKLISLIFCCLTSILLTGCAFQFDIAATHSPLKPVAQKRTGTILVHQFTDSRKENHSHMGTLRTSFGVPAGSFRIQDNYQADVLLTEFFVESLERAGYDAVIQTADGTLSNNNTNVSAVLRGDIKEFWLDVYPNTTKADVIVDLKLSTRDDSRVAWEKTISGKKRDILWVSLQSEFEKAIREALDEALNHAASEFASDEFYQKVNEGN